MKKKILLVEDTADILQNLQEFLLMEGYEVTIANNGIDALNTLNKELVDLIITDLLMPEMDGFQLIEKLRAEKRFSHIPILVYSAKPKEEFANKQLAADRVILKPGTPDEILAAVAELLGK